MYEFVIHGVRARTGDVICTTTGDNDLQIGDFWRILGRLVPGEVDHVAVYIGPDGRIVEACGKGVIEFILPGHEWDAAVLSPMRGGLVDKFYGVAYPLTGLHLSGDEEELIRTSVARYCLAQAAANKPYNLNFLDPQTEHAYYCSQLVYKAYLPHGINLNTGLGVPNLAGTDRIVFPQEIWSGCVHQQARPRDGSFPLTDRA